MEKLIVEENEIIEEELYQKIKKQMNKKDDWFTSKELRILKKHLKNWRNFDVIYMKKRVFLCLIVHWYY